MSSTTTTNNYSKSDYLQPSFSTSSNSYDSSQSPLALLAQTCSSIGKDCPSPNSAPPIITSLVTKSLSNLSSLSNNDKSFSITKRPSPSQLNSPNTNKKSTLPLKPSTISMPSSFVEPHLLSNHFPPLFDPTTTAAAFLLRSSLAYLTSQQQQQQQHSCTMPGCFQCETVRHLLSGSINNQPYVCHWISCNARFRSNEELIEHIRHNHKSSNHRRFHPYLKPSLMINNHDQLPFFYPHLSLSPMTDTKQRMNNNTNNNN